jgi:hypothetical protein
MEIVFVMVLDVSAVLDNVAIHDTRLFRSRKTPSLSKKPGFDVLFCTQFHRVSNPIFRADPDC